MAEALNRARIEVYERYEVEYWQELGATPALLRELIAKHGVMATGTRRALGE